MSTAYIGEKHKDPNAVLDYCLDWSEWLASGETITTSVWTVATGITKDSDSFTDEITKIWLSGGTDGERYTVANRITTSDSRTDERTMLIIVGHR